MLIIDGTTQIQEDSAIFERTYDMRGTKRRSIEIHIGSQDGLSYELLKETFKDGVEIKRQESRTVTDNVLVKEATETEPAEYADVPRIETQEFDLSSFVVAGDIIDKRDGTFVVYMGQKTESEIKDEEMAELLLMVGGAE